MKPIRLAICDDAKFICKSIRLECSHNKEFDFCGEAYSAKSCVELVARTKPDVLLLDIQMESELAGIEIIEKLKSIHPEIKIVILTSYDNDDYIFEAFANGADDFVVKSDDNSDILMKCKNVYYSEVLMNRKIAKVLSKRMQHITRNQNSMLYLLTVMAKLSPSEFEVLRYICEGHTYKTIAKKRFVEECTIKTLVARILRKFEVSNMKELRGILKELNVFEMFGLLED